ncbi:RHS repeat domain-containing protein [Rhodoferax sp. BAB1]|uniref:RHS repeat domain-containing protein n=1 Tax=Rhodoferax sp. BAB1 TaxID=2741720 RepID=UPI0015752576|nr:RHS repeat domain-containing protein [Rhodoferax sp. BAB1]QKO21075.1 RHS repeat protein [Rhodoferax sp. BAB1]
MLRLFARLQTLLLSSAWSLLALFVCIAASVYSFPAHAVVERYSYDPLGRLVQYVDSAGLVTEYTYDAAGNLISVTGAGAASGLVPVLSTVAPSIIRRGESKSLLITGQRLQVGSLRSSDPGLDLLNVRQAATQIQADLIADQAVPVGAQTLSFSNAQGTASIAITVAPVLPVLSVEPSPLALPPDNTTRNITLRLSSSDVVSHIINLAMSDTSKATISPASVTITPGQSSVQVSVTPKVAGFTSLQLTSSTLVSTTVPVFITADFRGVNTSQAMPVGLVVGSATQPPSNTTSALFSAPLVGVAVGPVLTGITPAGMPVGQVQNLVVSGRGIPAGATLSVLPSTGLTLGTPVIASDGSQISATLDVAANATPGGRGVVVKDASGRVLPFVPAAASQLMLTSGQPEIFSIEPLYAKAGTLLQLKVRGRHLQNGRLALLPGIDVAIDPQPVINATGTELTATVQLYPLAALGPRVVQITTPSGQSSAEFNAANQFNIVSQINGTLGPVFAPVVGIMVGDGSTATPNQSIGPVASPSLGVVVGGAAYSVTPKVAVVGTSLNLTVTGVGLQAVQSVSLLTPDGITASAFSVNPEGTVLTLPITVDATAAKVARKLVLQTATGRIPFVRDAENSFLVAAPAPEIIATAPQVIKAGTSATLTLRGKNFRDVLGVRFEPAEGLAVTANATITANADGTLLTVPVTATASATTGPRTVIVVAAGGESSNVAMAANTVQVAQQVGATYADISAPAVGLLVGSGTTEPAASSLLVSASLVGVVVEAPLVPVTDSRIVDGAHVGVSVGGFVTGTAPATPDGFLIGTTSTLTVQGVGLDKTSAITSLGHAGITFGTWTVNSQGTLLTVPVTVASGVPAGRYGVALSQTVNGVTSRFTTVPAAPLQFNVGALPTLLESVSPIVLEQGKSYTFTARGEGLKDVYELFTEPGAGVQFGSVQWGSDAFGELLSVSVRIDATAAIGSRVVRLRVPGGLTGSEAVPANTITIVSPQ